jgi:hypothetical protein
MNASEAIVKMHGPLVSNLALSLAVHSPLIGLIIGLFAAVANRVSLGANGESRLKQSKQTAFCSMAFPLKTKVAHASPERGRGGRLTSGTKEPSIRALAQV